MSVARYFIKDDFSGCPLPFETPKTYKVYHDGRHLIATRCFRSQVVISEAAAERRAEKRVRSALDIQFDDLFLRAYNKGLRDRNIKRKLNNLHHRIKRFRRKAYLNKWNYFVTFTYDNEKHDEDTFKRKLRRCLSNLHTRRGWRYMGVFERAPETGRLHFHGLLYVPDGEMLGKLEEKTDYSTAQEKMQTRNENSFFAKYYGRNDFEEITEAQMEYGNSVDYILKYIGKTNERIVYSRGVPTEICLKLTEKDVVTELTNDFAFKVILFDDVVNWERDILRCKYKQMSLADLLCNPPQSA